VGAGAGAEAEGAGDGACERASVAWGIGGLGRRWIGGAAGGGSGCLGGGYGRLYAHRIERPVRQALVFGMEVDAALACPSDGLDQAVADLLRAGLLGAVRDRQRLVNGMEALIDGIQRLIQQQCFLVGGVSAGIGRH